MPESKIPNDSILDHLLGEAGPGTPSQQELEQWLAESEANAEELSRFERIWKGSSRLASAIDYNSDTAFKKIDSVIQNKAKRNRLLVRLSLAGSGIAATVLVFYSLMMFFAYNDQLNGQLSVRTPYGDRSEVTLPDGTKVELNAGSTIDYKFDPKEKTRLVSFSGEAYFEVAKSCVPFVITTPSGLQVKVLGTKFNLEAYPEDSEVKTTLFEGSVALTSANSADSYTMKPGQIVSYLKNERKLVLQTGEPEKMLSWVDNKLYMDEMPLSEVCKRLERWYNVNIEINDFSQIGEIHYTGVLKEETIGDVLDALCQLSPISYTMNGNHVTITKR